MAAVQAFVRANGFDRMVIDSPQRAARHHHHRQGLSRHAPGAGAISASTERAPAALGIRLYKVGMTWPLEPEGARRFAEGLQEILVVEEKRGILEDQLVRLLYNCRTRRAGRGHRQDRRDRRAASCRARAS